MDSTIKLNPKKTTRLPILHSLIKFFLVTICLGLFLSSPLWLPFILSFLNSLKTLFIVCNLIIAILFGQSKFGVSSPPCDIYEEYVRIQRLNTSVVRVEKDVIEDREEEEEEEEEEGEGDDKALDELNRRVEDFIAKVNKQRMIEAKMMMAACSGSGGEERRNLRINDWIDAY